MLHMVSQCPYCKAQSQSIVINRNGELVCTECASVVGVVAVWPRRRLTQRELVMARLYGYA
jgi:transcription initiation factor TFIIIB Brf1 subunit/transcription initiation factor TFIIB